MSTASVVRCAFKIASAWVIHQEMLKLMGSFTSSSLDLSNTRDKVLVALAKDVETHILNDGFRQGVEMYFTSLMRQLTLVMELASIGSNAEVQANLDAVEVERKP